MCFSLSASASYRTGTVRVATKLAIKTQECMPSSRRPKKSELPPLLLTFLFMHPIFTIYVASLFCKSHPHLNLRAILSHIQLARDTLDAQNCCRNFIWIAQSLGTSCLLKKKKKHVHKLWGGMVRVSSSFITGDSRWQFNISMTEEVIEMTFGSFD